MCGSEGAHLTNALRTRPISTNSDICEFRHTALYDQGCEELFRWLVSGDDVNPPQGRVPRPLKEREVLMPRNDHRWLSEIF